MKRFFIALVTGIIFAIVGFALLYLIFQNMNLGCRDCQGAAGIIVLILFGSLAFFFIVGFLIGFFYKGNKA